MFEIGKEDSRGKDIHDVYGGTRQAGISPSQIILTSLSSQGRPAKRMGIEAAFARLSSDRLKTAQTDQGNAH